MKDPEKVLLPSGNLVLIALGEDESGDHISFTLFVDLLLDLSQGSAIEISVSRSLGVHITGLTHVVRSPIALSTDSLSPSVCLPFNFRPSNWHILPQARPSST